MTIADSINVFLQNSRQEVEKINADCEKELESHNARLQELDRQVREVKASIEKVYAEKDSRLDRVETMNAGALAYHNFLRDAGLFDVEKLASLPTLSESSVNETVEREPCKVKIAAEAAVEEEPELPEIKRPDFDLDEYDESFDAFDNDDGEDGDDFSDYVPASDVLDAADVEDEFDEEPEEEFAADKEEAKDEDDYDENDEWGDEDREDYEEDDYEWPDEAYDKYAGLTPEQTEKAKKMDAEMSKYGDEPVLWPIRKNTEYFFDVDKYEYVPVMLGSPEAEEYGLFASYGYGNYEDDGVETGGGYSWDIKEPTPSSQVPDDLKRRREFVFYLHGEAQKTTLRSDGACFLGKPKRLAAIERSELEFAAKNRPDMFDAYVDQRYATTGLVNRVKIFDRSNAYCGEEPDFELIKTMIERKCFRLNVEEYLSESGQSFESFKLMWDRLSRTSAVPFCRFVLNRKPRANEAPDRAESHYGKCRFEELYIEMLVTCDPEEDDTLKMNYELATQ